MNNTTFDYNNRIMNNFYDINFWIDTQKLQKDSSEEIIKIDNILNDNNISSVILSNKLGLSYDWNTGNSKLISNSLLNEKDNIFFSFTICPEAYLVFDLDDYIKSVLKKKVRMFRVFPKSHLFYLNDFYMKKIFKVLSCHRTPVMLDLKQIDITGNKYFDMVTLMDVLRENRKLPVILECSLKMLMFSRLIYPLLEENENLYIEISNLLLINQIEDMVERFGPERFVFGSNYPDLEPGFTTGRLRLSEIKTADKKKIAYGNIKKILDNINYT